MNPASYAALPDDLRAIIDAHSGLEFSANAGRVQQSYDAPGREMAEDQGNMIITLDETQVAAWRAAAAPTIQTWVADLTASGIDGAALVDRARALIAENQPAN